MGLGRGPTPSLGLKAPGRWRCYDLVGIISNKTIVPVKAPEGLKITSGLYYEMLKCVILLWLEDVPPFRHRKFVFMQDNESTPDSWGFELARHI